MDATKTKRLEMLLEQELGPDWLNQIQLYGTENLRRRAGKDLTSFVAYPDRGNWGGDNQWRGNCSPKMVEDIINYVLDCKRYYRKDSDNFIVLDPMSGSGTTEDAANHAGVQSILYDLNPDAPKGIGGWNALRDDVGHDADLIFFHPPYHSIVQYSGRMWGKTAHPDDLSCCSSYPEFIEKLNYVIRKLYMSLRRDGRLAILVGDVRYKGQFHSIQNDMMSVGTMEAFVVKAQYNCKSDNRQYSKPFVPIVTEYLLLMKKEGGIIIPFSRRLTGTMNLLKQDHPTITWQHLIRSVMEEKGGRATSEELYEMLAEHPKAQKNQHYKDRIRAVIQEHPNTFRPSGRGSYELAYAV